jgi:hypothetical protein
MLDERLTRIVVTRSDGVLVGVLRREDLDGMGKSDPHGS